MLNNKIILVGLAVALVGFGIVTQNYFGVICGVIAFAVAAVQMLDR